jgi:hypothetical protein
VALAQPAYAQNPRLTIDDVRMGFQGVIRPGAWLPVTVDVKAGQEEVRGVLEIMAPDSDHLGTSLFQAIYLAPSERRSIFHFVKYGGADSEIKFTIRDESGRELESRKVEVADGVYESLFNNQKLLIAYGAPAGLKDAVEGEEVVANAFRFKTIPIVTDLPVQWFAYSAVDHFVLLTRDPKFLDDLDPARVTALQTWVRQGGKLIVSVTDNWQRVANSFLAEMLPARLTNVTTTRAPDSLEIYANAKNRLNTPADGLPVASVEDVRGKILVEGGGRPLVITGNYGLGTVTLLTFDAESNPFADWQDRQSFWIKLLNVPRFAGDQEAQQQYGYYGVSEVGTLLLSELENFPDVTVVPFGIVALLIFGYILLIGPIDYFFLKRVVGRLELTWITFPSIVILVSVGAYFSAHWLKGDDLRINRIDFVDIDQPSRTLRGRSYSALFSPQIARYTLAMQPELAAGDNWASLGMGAQQTDRVASWFGLPENAYRGNYGQGSTSLLGRRGYLYHDADATAVEDVPIQVWSVKTFENHWLAQSADILDARLRDNDSGVEGALTNRLDHDLEDVRVFYGDFVQTIDNLKAGAEIDLATVPTRTIRDYLDVTAVKGEYYEVENRSRPSIIVSLLFSEMLPETSQRLPNHALRDLDLSRHLNLGRILILARVKAPGGRLWLNALPAPEKEPPPVNGMETSETYLRILVDPLRDNP